MLRPLFAFALLLSLFGGSIAAIAASTAGTARAPRVTEHHEPVPDRILDQFAQPW